MSGALRQRLRRVAAALPAPAPEAGIEFDFSALSICELVEATPLLHRAAEGRLAGDALRRMEELDAKITFRPRQPMPASAVAGDRCSPFGPRPQGPPLAPCPGCPRCRPWSGPR